jgi:hypothetical protein
MNKVVPVHHQVHQTDGLLSPSRLRTAKDNGRRQVATRRYDITYLTDHNTHEYRQVIAPSLPSFEAAFSAYGRGLLIDTSDGPCAVEDLTPGMMIETMEYGPLPVLWIGSMQIIPNLPVDRPELASLVRIMADRFGIGRPVVDMILGPSARILTGDDDTALYTPAHDMVDGDGVFQLTPPAPTRVYHLVLPRHATVLAGGLRLESYHPGRYKSELLGPELLRVFLTLFPQFQNISEFGRMTHGHADETRELKTGLF